MLKSILRLARLNLQIAWCRRGPQDLPAVGILLPLTTCAYVLLSLAIGSCVPQLHHGWAMAVLADTMFLAAWYWLLLAIAGRMERYVQTASAIFGLQTLLAVPSIAELWLNQWRATDKLLQASLPLEALDLALMAVVLGWTLLATSHIVRQALQRSSALCWILAFTQMLSESFLLSAMYP